MGTEQSRTRPRSINYTYLPEILKAEEEKLEKIEKKKLTHSRLTPIIRNGKLLPATDGLTR